MNSFQLTIVTPMGKVLDEMVEGVSVPGGDGSFSVLAHHTPIASTLKKGIIRVKKANEEKTFQIDSGIIEMNEQNLCVILSNHIEPANK